MKKTLRITALLAAAALALSACEKPNNQHQGGNEVNYGPARRDIVYTVGSCENHQTLETEREWDALLDVLCREAKNGKMVTFYNMDRENHPLRNGEDGIKTAKTYSTTDVDEMKSWIKEREKEGLTVVVTYSNGTWNGMAYVSASAPTTLELIVGTWHFNYLITIHISQDSVLINSDLHVPENDGESIYWTFSNDGTLKQTIHGRDGITSDNSTWVLSADGGLCCDLLPNGGCWDVNWLTDKTMIISRTGHGAAEGEFLYQVRFDRE